MFQGFGERSLQDFCGRFDSDQLHKNKKTNMIVFKNINDNKTYIIYKAPNGNCLAIPFKHDGPSIPKCDMKDFVVVTSDEGRLDGFL